jgi:hypothetical protein
MEEGRLLINGEIGYSMHKKQQIAQEFDLDFI